MPPLSDADESLLDRLFDLAVACRARGEPVDVDAALGDRLHLRERAAEVVALATDVAPASPPRTDPSQQFVPGFELLEEIGRGGMGIVYRARQRSLDRIVALKVLAPALMASERARRRFAIEANALARLQHPNLVTVHDVMVGDGLCAYAMEWIDGPTLSRAIERGDPRLTLPGIVDLFVDLSRALTVVHTAGLVHRDVKPGNVLLRANGLAVLSDFSLVRATEHSMHTATGDFVGTAAYAAPEQLRGDHERVDARSDVYSLGATLHVALTGELPYGIATASETLRRIEEGRFLPIVRRNTNVPRDLATIVGKALDPDPERRYESAASFGDDLDRWRRHLPIHARPAGAWLRLRRWTRRHPGLAAAVAVLTLGVGTTSWFAVEASAQATQFRIQKTLADRRAEENAALAVAETAAREAAEANSRRATERAEELEQIARFHEHQWQELDAPRLGLQLRADLLSRANAATRANLDEALVGVDLTDAVRSLLEEHFFDRSLATIATAFPADSLVQARLRHGVAKSMAGLGIARAAEVAQAAHAVHLSTLGPDHPATLASAHDVAAMLEKNDPTAAGAMLRDVLARRERVLGTNDPATQQTRRDLAAWMAMHAAGAEALAACREQLAASEATFGADDRRTIEALGQVVAATIAVRAFEDAAGLARDRVARCRRSLGADDPDTARAWYQLGVALHGRGELHEAATTMATGLAGIRRARGTEHPEALEAAGQYGLVLAALGRLDEAEPCLREVVAGYRRLAGDQALLTLRTKNDLGLVLRAKGDLDGAEPLFRDALAGRRSQLGEDHDDTLVSLNNLATLLHARRDHDAAEPLYRACVAARERIQGPDGPNTLVARNNLAALLFQQKKHEECAAMLQDLVPRSRRVFGGRHPTTLQHVSGYANVLVVLQRHAEAEPLLREALAGQREVLGTAHADTLDTTQKLAALLRKTARPAETIDLLTAASDDARRTLVGPHATRLATWLATLGKAHAALSAPPHRAAAEACFVEVVAIRTERLGADHADTRRAIEDLVAVLDARHADEPAGGHDRRATEWRGKLTTGPR